MDFRLRYHIADNPIMFLEIHSGLLLTQLACCSWDGGAALEVMILLVVLFMVLRKAELGMQGWKTVTHFKRGRGYGHLLAEMPILTISRVGS